MTTQVFTSGKLNIQHQQHNHSSGKPQQMPAPSGENEQLLFNSAIFQLYHGENKLIFNEMMMKSTLFLTNTLSSIFIVLAHWHNSPRQKCRSTRDTLFWFWANQSLFLLLNAACLADKQQIPIF